MSSATKIVEAAVKPRFAVDVLKLAAGTGLAQAVGIVTAPIIARLFSPEAFGVSAVFLSVTTILGIVECLRYESAILLPAKDEDAANVLAVSLSFVLLVTLLTVPCIWLSRRTFTGWLNAVGLSSCLSLLPVTVLLNGLYAVLRNWSTRKSEFGILSTAQLLISVCTVGAQIAFGYAGSLTGRTLVVGSLVGLLVGTFLLGLQRLRTSCEVFSKVHWRKMIFALTRYARFPKYSTAGGILNGVSWQLPTFFLSSFFSQSIVGQYSLGNRLLRIPMNLIGLNIANVFAQRVSAATHESRKLFSQLVENTFRYLVSVSMFPCLILSFIGKDLFVVICGERWGEAGVYTQILSIWVCFWFISSPLSTVLGILEEQALELRINVLIFSSRFLSLLIGCLAGSPRLTLGLFSATGVLVYGYYCLAILRKSGVSAMKMFRILATNFGQFIPPAFILIVFKYYGASSLVVLGVSSLMLVGYYFNLIRTDAMARGMFMTFLHRTVPADCP